MNCPNCGKEIAQNDKFCMGCGKQLADSAATFDPAAFTAFTGKVMNGASGKLMGTGRNGVDFMVRRYFFGFGDLKWFSVLGWILFGALKSTFGGSYYQTNGFGNLCSFLQVVAVIVFIGAFILDIYTRLIGMGKNNVDQATQKSIQMLRQRAIEKFNVDEDQIREVEPIVIAGAGATPSLSFNDFIKVKKVAGLISKFYSKDPVEAYRIGNDAVPRYLLIQTTVYAFTDTQILVYSGNVDISTGIVYDERVSEIFYTDINCVAKQDILKKFKVGFFKKEYYTLRYLELDVNGISKLAAFDSRFAENADESLAGMESYIRDKKN